MHKTKTAAKLSQKPAAKTLSGWINKTNKKAITNILFSNGKTYKFLSERIKTKNTHGTGCSLASAITANLFLGQSLKKSVKLSINFVHNGIKNSFLIGKGHNPINHFADFRS